MNISAVRRILVPLFAVLSLAVSSSSVSFAVTLPNPVPLLYPIVPATAAPGGPAFTLTVTGAGFVSGSAVYWNGSVRTTTFVNSSKLTASIPASDIASAGAATITVFSPGPGGGASNSQFLWITTSEAQPYFAIKDVTGKVSLTSQMVGADFDNDGKLDLVGAVGSTIYVLRGVGDGTFNWPVASAGPAGTTITGINVADLNGDGKLDLILTGSKDSTTSFVATLFGNGDGTFQTPIETDFSGVHLPPNPIAADFNEDGVLDLAYTTGTSVQTILGNGDGTFHAGPSSPLNQIGLNVVATGDFNKDGKLDLVVTVYDLFTTGLDFVVVMPGNGDGSFGTPSAVSGSGTLYVGAITAAVGDFNNDGNLDIATGIQTVGATLQGFIQISLGNGDGTFHSTTNIPNVNTVTTPLLVADINGDGNLDLVTGGYGFFGQGDGAFPTFQGSTGNPTFVFVGDFNGDGRPDLLDQTVSLNGASVLTAVGVMLSIPPTPDFKGIVAPFSSTLVPGGSVSINVTLEPLYGFIGDVILSATDLPSGITPSYNPVLVHGGSGGSTITLTAANAVPLGRYTVTLNGNSGSITHSSTLPLLVNDSVGDWTGYAVQSTQNVVPGGTATYTFSTTPVAGFTGNITPTVSGLPPGADATFNPPVIAGGVGGTKLTVQTSSTTPQPQVYNLTVTGTEGILTHSETVFLGVSGSGGDFTGPVVPAQSTVKVGGSTLYQMTANPVNGGAGDIALAVSGVPPGVTAKFSPSATIPGSSGTRDLNITTTPGTQPGTYELIITATGSGVVHLSSVSLVVTP
jgi:hypothetical protein